MIACENSIVEKSQNSLHIYPIEQLALNMRTTVINHNQNKQKKALFWKQHEEQSSTHGHLGTQSYPHVTQQRKVALF